MSELTVIPEPIKPKTPEITYDDFLKLDLRVGTIVTAELHPNADKLLVLKVDLGEPEHRTICAGLKAHYDPAGLVGRQITVVANLAPRVMRGISSQGMLLAATDKDGIPQLITSASNVPVGTKVS